MSYKRIAGSKIESIDVREGDVTFYFEGVEGPFNAREFMHGSTTWEDLKQIEAAISWFNDINSYPPRKEPKDG